MADTKIKPQHHPAKSFLKSPLSLYFLAPSCLSGYKSILQNKPNFKMGNINISTASTKAYAKKQRTMNTERYPKQTQTKPIPARRNTIRDMQYETTPPAIRNTRYEIRDTNPNEPNVKIGKMKISAEIVRVYANQQRTMNNERYSKRTQSNPIPPPPTNTLAQRSGGVFLHGIWYVVLD
jgi:hypothetical protein